MTRTTAPALTMNYNLFMDAANTIIWGDGTSGTQFLTFPSTPGNKTYAGTIYGTIPAGLDVGPGNYTDTIQATLNWGSGLDQRFFTVNATVLSECTVSTSSALVARHQLSSNSRILRSSSCMVASCVG